MKVPVAVYVSVITVMMWRAAARVGSSTTQPLAARLGLAGAIAFGASDTLIAFDGFLQPIEGVRVADPRPLLARSMGHRGIGGARRA